MSPVKLMDFAQKPTKIKQMNKFKCPSCQTILNKVPTRKMACPNCKKYIYVRTSPKTDEKVYVTEKQMKKIDEEWKKYFSVNSQIYFVKRLAGEKEFNIQKEQLRIKFGQEPSDSDVAWRILNYLVLKAKSLHELQEIYYQMALLLNAEGKKCLKVRQEAEKCELKEYKKDGIMRVKILASSNSCKACKHRAKKIFNIEEALELKPIPCKECSFVLSPGSPPFCRCLYQGVVKSSQKVTHPSNRKV